VSETGHGAPAQHSADWIDDTEFAAYGLDDNETGELRQWALSWADDIALGSMSRKSLTRTDKLSHLIA
jgi:hypothetical protein